MTRSSDDAYLAAVLELDPAVDAARIEELRWRRSGPEAAGVEARRARAATPRAELAAVIDEVRATLWDLQEEAAIARLDALELADHPDLERARARLAATARAGAELAELERDPAAPGPLVAALRNILVAPPDEAARRREAIVRAYGKGPKARAARRFAKLVRHGSPALAELEGDWLERLRRAKREARDSKKRAALGCFTLWILASIIRRIIEAIG